MRTRCTRGCGGLEEQRVRMSEDEVRGSGISREETKTDSWKQLVYKKTRAQRVFSDLYRARLSCGRMIWLHYNPLSRQEVRSTRLATLRKPEKDRQLDDGGGGGGEGSWPADRTIRPQESLSSLNHSILSATENVKGTLLQANLFHVCTEYFMRLWAKLNYFPEHFMFRIYYWTHALFRMLKNFSTDRMLFFECLKTSVPF